MARADVPVGVGRNDQALGADALQVIRVFEAVEIEDGRGQGRSGDVCGGLRRGGLLGRGRLGGCGMLTPIRTGRKTIGCGPLSAGDWERASAWTVGWLTERTRTNSPIREKMRFQWVWGNFMGALLLDSSQQ